MMIQQSAYVAFRNDYSERDGTSPSSCDMHINIHDPRLLDTYYNTV